VPFPPVIHAGVQLFRRPPCQSGENTGGNAISRGAVAGRIGRAHRHAIGCTVCDDSRHGIAATVVFAEYLTQETPDRRHGAEHSVPKRHAMFIEHLLDAGLRQDVRERESLIARKAGAHRIQARHGTACWLTAILAARLERDAHGSYSQAAMPGCTSMPSVEVAASPECAALITATRRHHLYVCIVMACSLRPAHSGYVSCRSNAKCQDERVGEIITRPSPENFA